ncbi:hypothetical protein BGZ65_009899, partial [Modicella reniformis]
FPLKIIQMFSHGFPADWKEVLTRHFTAPSLDQEAPEADPREDTTTVDNLPLPEVRNELTREQSTDTPSLKCKELDEDNDSSREHIARDNDNSRRNKGEPTPRSDRDITPQKSTPIRDNSPLATHILQIEHVGSEIDGGSHTYAGTISSELNPSLDSPSPDSQTDRIYLQGNDVVGHDNTPTRNTLSNRQQDFDRNLGNPELGEDNALDQESTTNLHDRYLNKSDVIDDKETLAKGFPKDEGEEEEEEEDKVNQDNHRDVKAVLTNSIDRVLSREGVLGQQRQQRQQHPSTIFKSLTSISASSQSSIHDFGVLSTTSVGTGLNDDNLDSGASFAEGRRDPTMDVMALKDSVMTDAFFGNDSMALEQVSSLSIFGGDFTTSVRHGHATSEEDSISTSVNMDDMQQELPHDNDLLQLDALDQHDQPSP